MTPVPPSLTCANLGDLIPRDRHQDEDAYIDLRNPARAWTWTFAAMTGRVDAIGRGLLARGYRYIGMDHFALPDDALAVAMRQGRLHRNFQGYSTQPDCDLVAFGLSAMRRLDQTLAASVGLAAGLVLVAIYVHANAYSDFFEDPTTWLVFGLIGLAATRRKSAMMES